MPTAVTIPHGWVFSPKKFKEYRTQVRQFSLRRLAAEIYRFEKRRVDPMTLQRWEAGKREPGLNDIMAAVAQLHCDLTKVCEPKRRAPLSRDQVEHDRGLKERTQLRRQIPRQRVGEENTRLRELEKVGPSSGPRK